MKYRILSDEELAVFAEELKQFLIVTGVHAEEWEEMNRTNPEKAVQLVEIFSDQVLQTVYERIQFLEHRSENACLVFHCLADQIELISINKKDTSNVAFDLSSVEGIHHALIHHAAEMQFFKTEKPYSKTRETEIHELIEQGCFTSDKAFWEALLASIPA